MNKARKIILMAPTPPPYGGIAEWTNRIMKSQLLGNWEIAIVDEKVNIKRDAYSTKRNYLIEFKRSMNIWKNLKEKLKLKESRVVHCCIPATTFAMLREYISVLITKRYKKKFIIHFRCTVENMNEGFLWKCILKLLCNKCDKIIVLNEKTLKFLRKNTKTEVILIPNFVSNEEISYSDSYKVHNTIKKVVYVGGVMPTKGCLEILEVAKNFSNIEFSLIGKIDNEIEKKIHEDNIKNVYLLGTMPHDQILKHLINSDLFLFMSYYEGEGFSNALVEAMAIGLPCIVTNWAANKDMIEDKRRICGTDQK